MTHKHPIVYLNVETQLTAVDVGGWLPEKMGMSVAAALFGHSLRVWVAKDILELVSLLKKAGCVIGYNIARLDFKVLEGYPGVNLQSVKRLDLMDEIEAITGSRVVLESLQKATLRTTPRYDGMEAVRLWKEGRIADLVEVACNRVLAVKALHEIGCEEGRLFYYPAGRDRRKSIRVQWNQRMTPLK